MRTLIPLSTAWKLVFSNVRESESETISIFDSLGRVSSKDILSEHSFPIYSTAAVDGFAIKVSEKKSFEIIDTTYTGDKMSTETGGAIKVSTGAFIPPWANSVIMKEFVKEKKGKIYFNKTVKENENVNAAGSIFTKGEVVVKKGTPIDSGVIGIVCSVNKTEIDVFKKPSVAIIATGNEIVEPGSKDPMGIPNSSSHIVVNSALECGAEVTYLGIVGDDREKLKSELKNAFDHFDIVITTGGVSVGEVDLLPKIMKDVGVKVLFWKVLQKPGKPVLFGRTKRGIYLGIPGYPTAAATVAETYLKGCLRKMQGIDPLFVTDAKAAGDYSRTPRKRTELARCRLFFERGELKFEILKNQASSNPKNFSKANGLVVLEPKKERVVAGEFLKVLPKWGLKRATLFDVPDTNFKGKIEDLF
ncbi:MAG: molybdopterin molybdotransferase MoeA [Candidatus Altiarchaeota archaeon]|nr:molybdopterin molybdotransferase MoeA [Candidatus Altiarchaeota archaeon]